MRRSLLRLFVVLSMLVAAGSLAAVVVRAGGGCHGSETAVPSEAVGTTVVKIDGCLFLPTVSRVAVGSTVTFLNSGTGPHDVTGTTGRPDEWKSPLLEPGASYRHAFAKPGVYAYSCSLHPGMAGVVVASLGAEPPAAASVPPAITPAPAPSDLGPDPMVAGGAGLALGAVGSWILLRRRAVED
jgi:plastocyanin